MRAHGLGKGGHWQCRRTQTRVSHVGVGMSSVSTKRQPAEESPRPDPGQEGALHSTSDRAPSTPVGDASRPPPPTGRGRRRPLGSRSNSQPSRRGPSPSLHGGHAQGPPHVAGLAALHHHGADHVVPSRHVPLRELQRVQGEEDTVVDHPVSATEAGNADLRAQRADSLTNRPAHWPPNKGPVTAASPRPGDLRGGVGTLFSEQCPEVNALWGPWS